MKILVMRPSPEGEDLVNNLKRIGINAWHFSFFDFFPSTSLTNLSNKVNDLYEANVIIIFSKKSIYYTNLYLKSHNLQWPYNAIYYTIGQSTALTLYKYVKKKILFPTKQEDSENLLNMLHKYLLKRHKIVLLQGENGRKLIEKNLKKKGFNVCTIKCYKRILKCLNVQKKEKTWYLYKINALVVTSSEILYHIKNMMCSIEENNWLLKCKIFVISRRLFKIAKQLGWKDIVISNCASNECLIKIIKKETIF